MVVWVLHVLVTKTEKAGNLFVLSYTFISPPLVGIFIQIFLILILIFPRKKSFLHCVFFVLAQLYFFFSPFLKRKLWSIFGAHIKKGTPLVLCEQKKGHEQLSFLSFVEDIIMKCFIINFIKQSETVISGV